MQGAAASAQANPRQREMQEDFDFLWVTVNNCYGYFDSKPVDWQKAYHTYRPQAEAARSREELIPVLERMLEELYDPHTHLRANTPASTRLIPTGLDLWAEWKDGKAVVAQVRPGFGAEQAGVRGGMVIEGINGVPVAQAIKGRLGAALKHPDPAAEQWVLLALLAGRHDTPRTLRIVGRPDVVELDAPGRHRPGDETYTPLVDRRVLERNIGYVRVRDLGSREVIRLFDDAMSEVKATRGLMLDLRETPRGGNTIVGEHIIGTLIDAETPYQKIIPPNGQAWLKRASPVAEERRYTRPVVVLVNRWTGSMGEGIAIGLDAARRATVVGTRMAGLNGEVYDLTLPRSGIGFQFTANKIAHPNGTLREAFVPPVLVDLSAPAVANEPDPVLSAGLRALSEQLPR
jgi:carboxyl-terminal processing protease